MDTQAKFTTQKIDPQAMNLDIWSVKSPNQLNLVVESKNQDSSRNSEALVTPRDLQQQLVKGIKTTKTTTQPYKDGKSSIRMSRHNRNQTTAIQHSYDSVEMQSDETYGVMNDRYQENQRRSTRISQINNSHVPTKALDYLQLVDEPNLEKVVSQFNGHQFLSQFRNPLRTQSLFLSQVRQLGRNQQQAIATTMQMPPIKPYAKSQSRESFKNAEGHSGSIDDQQVRLSQTRSRNRVVKKNFFTSSVSGDPKASVKITILSSGVNQSPPMRSVTSNQQGARQAPHTSQMQYRNQNQSRQNRRNLNYASGSYSMNQRQSVFTNNDSYQGSQAIPIAQQDSIESVIQMCQAQQMVQVDHQLDPVSQHRANELALYSFNRQTYQPFYKENYDAQDVRKKRIIAQQHRRSMGNQQEYPLQTQDSVTNKKNEAKQQVVSAVISSALKVRNLESLKVRQNQQGTSFGSSSPPILQTIFTQQKKHQVSILTGRGETATAANTKASCRRRASKLTKKNSPNRNRREISPTTLVSKPFQTNQGYDVTPRGSVENPIDVRVQVNEVISKNQSFGDTQTQGLHSTHPSKPDVDQVYNTYKKSHTSKTTEMDPKTASLRQSQSASVKEASVLKPTQMENGIMSDCNTAVSCKSGGSTQLRLIEKEDSTPIRIDNKTASPGMVANHDKQLISGSMTMKLSAQVSTASNYQSNKNVRQEKNGQANQNSFIQQHLIHKNDTIGIDSTNDQQSIKINGKQITNKEQSINMTVIRQPSAQVEIKEMLQPSGVLQQPRHVNLALNQNFCGVVGQRDIMNNSPDYQEELKEAGIISKKFILKIGSTNSTNEREERNDGSTQNTIHEHQSMNGEDDLRVMSNPSLNGNGGVKVATGKLGEGYELQKERLLRIQMGEIDLYQDANADYQSERSSAGGENTNDYIITQYSLPKALVGFRNTNATNYQQQQFTNDPDPIRSVSQQRKARRQQILMNKYKAIKSFDQRTLKNIGELEQFHYERDFQQTLTGPIGSKVARHMAMKNQNIRKQQQEQKMKGQQSIIMKPAVRDGHQTLVKANQETNTTQQMSDKHSQISFITCQGGKVQAWEHSMKNSQSIINNDALAIELNQGSPAGGKLPNQLTNQPQQHQVFVPQLQLNKIELQFNADNNDRHAVPYGGNSSKSPSYYSQIQTQLNGFVISTARNRVSPVGAVDKSQEKSTNKILINASPNQNDKSERHQTRLISINVLPDGQTQNGVSRQIMKNNIITQERSVQDTLYESAPGNLAASQQRMLSSHKLAEIKGGRLGITNKSKDSKDNHPSFHQMNTLALGVNDFEQCTIEVLKENQAVASTAGGVIIAKNLIDNPAMVTQVMSDKGFGKHNKQSDMGVQGYTNNELRSNDTIKQNTNTATISGDCALISVQESIQTDPDKYLQTFRNEAAIPQDYQTKTVGKEEGKPADSISDGSPLNVQIRNKLPPNQSLNFSSKQSSPAAKHLRHQSKDSTGEQKRRNLSKNRDLNVLVKSIAVKPNKKNQTFNNQHKRYDQGDQVIYMDKDYQRDRKQILTSNQEVNLEEIMRLRYSSDEDSEGTKKQQFISNGNEPIEQQQLLQKQKLMNNTTNSYNTSEYVALQPHVMEAKGIQISTLSGSMEKTAALLYVHQQQQLQDQSQDISQRRSRQAMSRNQESICSKRSSSMRSTSPCQAQHQSTQEAGPQLPQDYSLDNNWLAGFCQSGMNNERALQNKRNLNQARRERLLAINAKQYKFRKSEKPEKTEPMSYNRMLQVPLKPHSRMRISKEIVQVENIWAKNQLEQSRDQKQTSSISTSPYRD